MLVIVRIQCVYAAVTDFYNWGLTVTRTSDVGGTQPDPNSNQYVDWLMLTQEYADSGGTGVDSVRDYRLKGRRKLQDPGQTLALCINSQAAATHNVTPFLRVLLALL